MVSPRSRPSRRTAVNLRKGEWTYGQVQGDRRHQPKGRCRENDHRSKCRLLVPIGTEELYKNADGWKDFYMIVGEQTLGVRVPSVSRVSDGQAYNLDGTPKPDDDKGIAIQDGKVIIRK